MSRETINEHAEFMEGYFNREDVQKWLQEQKDKRLMKYGNSAKGMVVRIVGAIGDQMSIFWEAEDHAYYKGYDFSGRASQNNKKPRG